MDDDNIVESIDVDIDNTGAVKCTARTYCKTDEEAQAVKEELEKESKRFNIPHFEVEIERVDDKSKN